MRVLVIHNILWSHYKAALFSELSAQCPPDAAFMVLQLAQSESKYQQLGQAGAIDHAYPHEVLHNELLNTLGVKKKLTGIIACINRFKPTIVNLSGYYDPVYWLVMAYCRTRGIKLVLSNESGASDGNRSGLKEVFKKFLVNQFSGFINFGTSSTQYVKSLGAKSDQIITSHAAVLNTDRIRDAYTNSSVSRANFPKHSFVFVGRLAKEKNLETLLNVFVSLKKQDSSLRDWGLLVVGDGPLRSLVEGKQHDDIYWLGGHPWNKVPEYLALADALILPSHFEPWGLVVNEAMVCGLPVLVSNRCGCVIDLVHSGKNGFTFDPENESELTESIRRFVSLTDHERVQMGEFSKVLIAPFETDLVAEEIWEGFRKIQSRH